MFKSFFIASFLLLSTVSFAQEVDPALVISSVEVHQVETPDDKATVELPKVPTNPIDEVAMYLDGLIAIGKKIWPIIEAGRPVITTNGLIPSLSVLPHIEGSAAKTELYQMANWSAPKAVSYRVSYKNLYGSEVIGFTYTVFFQYNGSYKGNGKYITSLKVQASQVYAAWGFNFDANSELVNVANVGSEENPVASAIIQISYKAKGLLNEMRNSESFYVDGAGTMQLLNP
ncbi:hypothetical protein DOM21_04870 [Bacteriovorax stolpii]|uniref:Uncharacterized protein n=1 Tax=Bacteriovorax stolpii TaxID=960 RepID=A0A2K9NUN5_BACTC|nr:hypothetical protein [Bacteriovorax stolpii]AUN99220.1 hypothetical protein C0V70_14130 [Bacteriovorax stolpii]QDK40798.1 hypothetical protein DOM21_04870 [Bacteriovorax stolpii]TDP55241.1 hypothetical protein C8D79_0286 [Bacteriovorax stolpii]